MSDERKRRRAVGLAYGDDETAPKVVARGYGELAERIVEQAKQHGIHVHDAPELVGLLMQLDLDEAIPPELYRIVAELLVWLHERSGAGVE
ncbi:EscU/YscU/HrcU family type III secretion system export apparatus switch protein [Halomonas elongata]|uniref:Flagellar biosynthetic protein FlhB n=1 Tax=Halomonas elongata (strain ATCC 33173 / DSM 2581 / NBRC 15536 / NCIMB 2198 / 1H9) TaxID=768066 RepID=E1VBS3_HALED|nr:EscU/YscU/HrcU family type III secretion system export apparatus switch protein [Halomonas elongata]MBW5800214.1 EscU/YscU/HrcU family type III secretion system export apparatus switch protein [Halomonas elongata]WBF17996.1 EscU/YscU/HrcU family type III secretion system export apparatus switch protein [Halomonas elongata]WPU46845.1 EscU/YscU/HrcU family type III secretion system export apparatus switch protein [Halomonas elongata DSM 2581]CBV44230.1 FlhB_Cterm domain protein [Halomonas elon